MHERTDMKGKIIALGASLMLGVALALSPTVAQQQQAGAPAHSRAAMLEAMDKMARFKHAELTEKKAKAAMEVFLIMREKYPPELFRSKTPGPDGTVAAMKASEKAKEILALVKEKGFSSIDDWANTFTSLGMAIAHVREGGDTAVEKRLKDVAGSSLPDEMKKKITAMIKATTPPKSNTEVAKKLLANEEAKKLIRSVENPPAKPARK